MKGPIEAVFLDVGGVFHLPLHERIVAALRDKQIEIAADLLDQAHYSGVHAMSAVDARDEGRALRGEGPSTRGPRGYFRGYLTALRLAEDHLEVAAEAIMSAFRAPGLWGRIVPGSIDALRRLAQTAVSLGIVSNSDGTLESRLVQEKICQIGEGEGVPMVVICDSTAVGVAKPDPGIFHIALEAVGVAPPNAVHVGDTIEADVKGALAAGVTPLHIDPYGFCSDQSHAHVKDLDDVTDMVIASRA